MLSAAGHTHMRLADTPHNVRVQPGLYRLVFKTTGQIVSNANRFYVGIQVPICYVVHNEK